jgi:hypothetical protein
MDELIFITEEIKEFFMKTYSQFPKNCPKVISIYLDFRIIKEEDLIKLIFEHGKFMSKDSTDSTFKVTFHFNESFRSIVKIAEDNNCFINISEGNTLSREEVYNFVKQIKLESHLNFFRKTYKLLT